MIQKTLTETYSLKGEKCLWAKINLDCGKQSVNVMITSDYGEFSHYWGSCGMNPKKFLTTIDMHYAMKKLMHGTDNLYEPDLDERLKSFKKLIIEKRLYNDITKHEARVAWNRIINIIGSCADEEYFHQCANSDEFEKIIFDWEMIPMDDKIKSMVVEFWEDIWLPFTEFLKDEIKEQQ
jgi:hypothetical protein